KHLSQLEACPEALEWAAKRSPLEAWQECERADWLLWWASQTQANTHQSIVLAACDCARRALRFVPPEETRPLAAIEAAEQWAKAPTEANMAKAVRAAQAAAQAAAAQAAGAAKAQAAAQAAQAAAQAAAGAAGATG